MIDAIGSHPAASEPTGIEEYTRAMLNILDDFSEEKNRLEETQRAILNILDDFSGEKSRFEDSQRAMLNILDDFSGEKSRLEDSQRAMLNLLEDFDVEREKTATVNLELRAALESLRRAKDTADSANRELQAFSYSVSHDLRAPLRSIDGFSQALMEDYHSLLDDRGQDYLRRVRGATQRMAQLIDDLLKLSRLTRGELNIADVDLSALTREVADDLQNSQPERQVSISIDNGLTCSCDPTLLKVVLVNLLGNAWKFTSKVQAPMIEFGVSETLKGETFFVRDNGAGFDMSYSDKLFATFQRLHLEKEFPGTGIGLSLVQRIIHRHGGIIWAEGKVGEGATFYFTLNPSLSGGAP